MASFTSTYSGDLSEFIAGKIWARVKKSIDDKKIDETNADPIVKDAAKKLRNDNDQDGVIVKDKNLRDQVIKIFGLDLDAKIVRTEGKVDKATAHVATIASGVADTQKLIINHNEVLERKFDEILGVLRDQNELKEEELEAEKVAEEEDDLEQSKQSGIGRRFAKMMGYPASWGTFLTQMLFSRVKRRLGMFLDPLRRRVWRRVPLLSGNRATKVFRLFGKIKGFGTRNILSSAIKRLIIANVTRAGIAAGIRVGSRQLLGGLGRAEKAGVLPDIRGVFDHRTNRKLWKFMRDDGIPLEAVGDILDESIIRNRKTKSLSPFSMGIDDALTMNRFGVPLSESVAKGSGDDLVQYLLKQSGQEVAVRGASKVGARATTKATTGKIPLIGMILSTGFAIERFSKGDVSGGILELISGLATTIPGKGTAVSYLIDAALIAGDVQKEVQKNQIRKELLGELQNANGYETGGVLGKGGISNLHGLEYKSTSKDRSAVASSFTDMMDGFISTLGGGLIGYTSGVGMSGVGQRLLKSEGVEGVQFASLPYSTSVGGEPTLATYSSGSSVFGSRDSIYNKRIALNIPEEKEVEEGQGGPGGWTWPRNTLMAQHSSEVPHSHPIVRVDASGEPGVDFTPDGPDNRAVFDGVVSDIGHQYNPNRMGGDNRMGAGYGHYIGITSVDPKTGEKFEGLYAHFPEGELDRWQVGDTVQYGDVLGKMGTWSDYANPETRKHVGSGTGPHTSLDWVVPGTSKPYPHWRSLVDRVDPSFRPKAKKTVIEEENTENNLEQEVIPPLPPIPDDLSSITPSTNTKSSDISRDSSSYNDMKNASNVRVKREIVVINNSVNTGSPTIKGSGGGRRGDSIGQVHLKRLATV